MLCDKCKKNEATVFLVSPKDAVAEWNLCKTCLKEICPQVSQIKDESSDNLNDSGGWTSYTPKISEQGKKGK